MWKKEFVIWYSRREVALLFTSAGAGAACRGVMGAVTRMGVNATCVASCTWNIPYEMYVQRAMFMRSVIWNAHEIRHSQMSALSSIHQVSFISSIPRLMIVTCRCVKSHVGSRHDETLVFVCVSPEVVHVSGMPCCCCSKKVSETRPSTMWPPKR